MQRRKFRKKKLCWLILVPKRKPNNLWCENKLYQERYSGTGYFFSFSLPPIFFEQNKDNIFDQNQNLETNLIVSYKLILQDNI